MKLAESRGEYLALLDIDDVWFPGKLSVQAERCEFRGCRVTCCDCWGSVDSCGSDGDATLPPDSGGRLVVR